MIFRDLDSNNDWTFGAGKNNYASGNKAIGLNISTRIKSWKNDCYFDQNAGVDWANRLGSKNQRDLLDQDIRKIILTSFGVTSIIDFDTIVNDRNFSATYNIRTIYSPSYQNSIEIGF
jgi:hypothetical protein